MLDTFQEIYGAIMRNKMRTIATGFAVASGLFLIIVLQGAGNGVINSFEANMGDFSFDAIHIFGGRTTKPFEGIKEGRFIQLDSRDVEMTERSFSHYVKDVMPSLNQSGLTVSHGAQHQSATLMGVKPAWAQANAVKIVHGRFINEIDLRQKRKSVVISDMNAQSLFPRERNVVGQTLDFNGISYTVVGVYKDEQMSNERTFYAPFTTVGTIYNSGQFINRLSMVIRHIETDSAMNQFMDEYTRASSHVHSFRNEEDTAHPSYSILDFGLADAGKRCGRCEQYHANFRKGAHARIRHPSSHWRTSLEHSSHGDVRKRCHYGTLWLHRDAVGYLFL